MKKFNSIVLIATAISFMACSGNKQSDEPIHSVEVVSPIATGDVSARSISGTVVASEEIGAGFKTSGHIQSILVKEGDIVHKGQTIATLDAKDIRLQVQTLQVQYDQTARQVARLKKLYEGKSVSGNDYDKAVSGLEQTSLMLQQQKNRLSYTVLSAPVSGVVKAVNMEQSEMAMEGQSVVTIVATGNMEIKANVPSDIYLKYVKKALNLNNITCKSANDPEKQVLISLKSITPLADDNQLYETRFNLPAKTFNDGENVEISLNVLPKWKELKSTTVPYFSVPLKALFKEGNKCFVWVLKKDSTVTKREVNIMKLDDDGNAEIWGNIGQKDKIIKAGVNALQDKEKVRVIAKPSETNVGGML